MYIFISEPSLIYMYGHKLSYKWSKFYSNVKFRRNEISIASGRCQRSETRARAVCERKTNGWMISFFLFTMYAPIETLSYLYIYTHPTVCISEDFRQMSFFWVNNLFTYVTLWFSYYCRWRTITKTIKCKPNVMCSYFKILLIQTITNAIRNQYICIRIYAFVNTCIIHWNVHVRKVG